MVDLVVVLGPIEVSHDNISFLEDDIPWIFEVNHASTPHLFVVHHAGAPYLFEVVLDVSPTLVWNTMVVPHDSLKWSLMFPPTTL